MQHNSFIKYSWFLVGMVFIVILAGGVVRMTQSGMGCPDWPRCFGLWIPPINESQLPTDFEKYLSKQDIDHSFNVYHTWIEYINRLLGAILGLFILFNMIWAWRQYRLTNKKIVIVSFILLVSVGFQGWLGKLVVDSNLSVVKITIHMVVAILIAILPLINISSLKKQKINVPKSIKNLLLVLIGLLIIQVVMGTQVREQIDEISKLYNYGQREYWISKLDKWFLVHRSFSWIIILGCGYLWWKGRFIVDLKTHLNTIIGGVTITIIMGVIMAYFNMPAIAQPLHLLFTCGLITTLTYSYLRIENQS